jgi:hypothetical protein
MPAFTFSWIGQVWWLIATAHGVRLASIRPGRVWLLRSTAHGALLGSTRLDQVYLDLMLWHIVSWLVWDSDWNMLAYYWALQSSSFMPASFTWWSGLLHWTGVVTEDNCMLCAAGKYQTGSGPYLLLNLIPVSTNSMHMNMYTWYIVC